MTETEALDIVTQLARATAVNGEVGDKRDEAIAVLKALVDKPRRAKKEV